MYVSPYTAVAAACGKLKSAIGWRFQLRKKINDYAVSLEKNLKWFSAKKSRYFEADIHLKEVDTVFL